MSKIVVCYKWVKDEADIRINADLSVDLSKAKGKISDYDRNTIEAAMQAAAAQNSKAVALTFGTAKAKQSLKDALSRGPEEAYYINGEEALKADGAATAKALAAAIKKIEDVNLVICSEGASDTFARQTAPRMGVVLEWPTITSVVKLEFSGNTLTATRKLENIMEVVKVELPAVIAVLPEINSAPIPGLSSVIAASKKPITEFKTGDLGIDLTPKTAVSELRGYAMNRKNIIFKEGGASERVELLAAALRKEGVL